MLTEKEILVVLSLWAEQNDNGIGDGSEPNTDRVWEWVNNHCLDQVKAAAAGDVEALVALRQECGLPILH